MKLLFLSSLCFLLLLTQSVFGFNPEDYTNQQTLHQDYTLYWKVDGKLIRLAVQVKTLGWIGFGLGEQTTGSMPGSDIAAITFKDGKPKIRDLYATAFATPNEDNCQSWVLVKAKQDPETGITTAEFRRELDTGDLQDRPIAPGRTKVVYAYGEDSDKELTYHQSRRGATEVEFIPDNTVIPVVPDPDTQTASFTVGNFQIPAQTTTYACSAYEIPLPPDSADHHVIQIDPLIDPKGAKYAHHLIVHICDNTSDTSYVNRFFNNTGECMTPIGDSKGGCVSLLYAWATGVGSLVVPSEAGYRMGWNRPAFKYMVLELHYDNADQDAGVIDNSGFTIHYTKNLRKYDAGTITLGDPFVQFPPIPPQIESNPYEATCPSSCTQKFDHDIYAFGSFLHMHMIGSQMWTTQYRDGKLLRTTNRAEYYSFDFQQQTMVNFTIQRGDRLNTHCVYNSKSRDHDTIFGVQSHDEMCMDFISYYPRLEFNGEDFAYCGYFPKFLPNGNTTTLCGSVAGVEDMSSILFVANPEISDLQAGLPRVFGTENCKFLKPLWIIIGIVVGVLAILLVIAGGILYSRKQQQQYVTLGETHSM